MTSATRARLLIVLLILWVVSAPSPPPVRAASVPADGLTVVSVNLAKATDIDRVLRELQAAEPMKRADVYLFQEVVQTSPRQPSTSDTIAARLGYKAAFASPEPAGTTLGLGIVSRYPLEGSQVRTLKSYNLVFHTRKRIALATTARTPLGPIRIVNAHLDTRINAADRCEQLRPVIADAKAHAMPHIIGGDLNTNNIRWLANVVPVPFLQVQTRAVEALMKENGFATPFHTMGATHDLFGFRLDWLFYDQLRARAAGVQPLAFSDHHAIWANFGR